jgi:hypothetical protein
MGLNLKSIFSAGAEKLASAVGDAFDKNFTNKEEKEAAKLAMIQEINRNFETLSAQANDLEKAYIADVQDARNANVKIQESDKASWLAKNIAYLLDIWMGLIWGLFTMYVLSLWAKISNSANVDFTGILSLYTTVTAVFMITVNFHRGTSQGSHDKQKLIDRLQRH